MKHVAFFGDGERTFSLTPELIIELERKTGSAIGALFQRVHSIAFRFDDLAEIIRLALIGGGTAPHEAASLVDAYVKPRPFNETFPLALTILEILWTGESAKEGVDNG